MSKNALIIEKTCTYDVHHERIIISNFGRFLGKIWFEKNDDVMVIEICTKLQQSGTLTMGNGAGTPHNHSC